MTKRQKLIMFKLLNKSWAIGALDQSIEQQDEVECKERYGASLAEMDKAYDALLNYLTKCFNKTYR